MSYEYQGIQEKFSGFTKKILWTCKRICPGLLETWRCSRSWHIIVYTLRRSWPNRKRVWTTHAVHRGGSVAVSRGRGVQWVWTLLPPHDSKFRLWYIVRLGRSGLKCSYYFVHIRITLSKYKINIVNYSKLLMA